MSQPNQIYPADGSVWADRDPREKGRKLVVLRTEGGYVYGISRERQVRIRLDRFGKAWSYLPNGGE